MQDQVLRVEEAARLLRIGRNACYEAIARGELPAVRIGKSIRISRSALDRWIGGDAEGPEPPHELVTSGR